MGKQIGVIVMAMLCAWGTAEARKPGGGGGHPVYVYVPGRSAGLPDLGEPAGVKFEMLPGPAKETAGLLTPGAVIARRTLRALDAIVLTETVKQGVVEIPAGTVMARVALSDSPTARNVWCAVRQLPALHAAFQDCVQDAPTPGAMTALRSGYLTDVRAPLSVIGVTRTGLTTATPVAFRPATKAELPTVEVGYRFCNQGDGVSIPWRFNSTMRTLADGWAVPDAAACPFGEWLDSADKTVEMVDQLKVKLTPAADGVHYEVLTEMASGPLAPVQVGDAIQVAGAYSRKVKQELDALSSVPLRPTGPPETVNPGVLAHGDAIAIIPVVHGVTGVLKNDVKPTGLFSPSGIPAGSYVFGVPTNINDANTKAITWCAPRVTEGDVSHPSTVCFLPVGLKTLWVNMGPALMVTHSTYQPQGVEAVGLDVERKPAAYAAPMKLTYVFDRWDIGADVGTRMQLFARIGVEIRVNGVMTPIDHLFVTEGDGGTFRLPVMGGVLTFTPVRVGGGRAELPPINDTRDAMTTYMTQIAADKALVEVQSPLQAYGATPLKGTVRMRTLPPPPLMIRPTRPAMPLVGPPLPISPPSSSAAQPTAPAAP